MSTVFDDEGRLKPVTLVDLYVHARALRGVETFKRAGIVGLHPMYLVGMTLAEHRGGPARIALVMLADGRVLAAAHRSWRGKGKQDINDIIQYDEHGMSAQELREYTTIWRETFGGFSGMVMETASDGEVAHVLIEEYADIAGGLMNSVAHCHNKPPSPGSHWDPADAMVMSEDGTVCAVHGFTPDHSLVASLGVSHEVKRAMTIAPRPTTDVLVGWSTDVAAIESTIPALVAEAWAVRLVSPRAAVALYRTAAERLVDHLGVALNPKISLNQKIQKVTMEWIENPPTLEKSALLRELARRARITAALDSLREMGNMIHQVDPVSLDDATWSHTVLEVLIEAALHRGTLDRGTH